MTRLSTCQARETPSPRTTTATPVITLHACRVCGAWLGYPAWHCHRCGGHAPLGARFCRRCWRPRPGEV